MIQGAIFDQDGLLFDTEVIFQRCWREAGAAFGVRVPDGLPLACCGVGRRELTGVVRRYLPEIDAEKYVERAHTMAAETQIAMTPEIKPGVREILAFCRGHGIRTAIASSSMRRLVDHNLAATGLTDLFDAIVTGRDVTNGKPAPDIFLLAAERLGLDPRSCAVFEDAHTGIRAAHAAGCRPILIPDRLPPTPELEKICEVYPTLLAAIPHLLYLRD